MCNNSNDKNKENETKKTIIEDKDESKMEMEPNETNNTLSLKTKNLNKALQNLDLITEGELRDFNKKNIKKRNIIKHLKKESKTQKTDYTEERLEVSNDIIVYDLIEKEGNGTLDSSSDTEVGGE